MKKFINILAASCIFAVIHGQAFGYTPLQYFGTTNFSVEPLTTDMPYTQTPTALVFSNSYTFSQTLGGHFDSAKDFSSYTSQPPWQFGLVFTLTGFNPDMLYSVELFDSTFTSVATYNGVTTGLVAGQPTFSPLTLAATGGGSYSNVSALQFTWGNDGTINVSLESLGVVPETSTASLLLASLGAFILVGYSFRKLNR